MNFSQPRVRTQGEYLQACEAVESKALRGGGLRPTPCLRVQVQQEANILRGTPVSNAAFRGTTKRGEGGFQLVGAAFGPTIQQVVV